MIISKNFVFIHNPRTAGTTISNNFITGSRCVNVPLYSKILSRIDSATYWHCVPATKSIVDFSNLFVFGFIRNPYSREYSTYGFIKKELQLDITFEKFISIRFDGGRATNGMDKRTKSIIMNLFKCNQYGFFCDIDKNIITSNIYRFENLTSSIDDINKTLGIEINISEKKNASNEIINYKEAYNDEMKEYVKNFYQVDLDCFGYDFDGVVSNIIKSPPSEFYYGGDLIYYPNNWKDPIVD